MLASVCVTDWWRSMRVISVARVLNTTVREFLSPFCTPNISCSRNGLYMSIEPLTSHTRTRRVLRTLRSVRARSTMSMP